MDTTTLASGTVVVITCPGIKTGVVTLRCSNRTGCGMAVGIVVVVVVVTI